MQVLTPEPTTTEPITGEELLALGDIGRSELVEGKIVLKSPTGGPHGGIEFNIGYELGEFVRPRKLGRVRVGEVGIYTHRNPDTVRAPDVLFISKERAKKLKPMGYMDVAPELVVEVMSPDDRWQEVTKKLAEYFEIGVRVVLIAEPDAQQIFAYRSLSDVHIFNSNELLIVEDILPGFSVPVSALFDED